MHEAIIAGAIVAGVLGGITIKDTAVGVWKSLRRKKPKGN